MRHYIEWTEIGEIEDMLVWESDEKSSRHLPRPIYPVCCTHQPRRQGLACGGRCRTQRKLHDAVEGRIDGAQCGSQ